MGLICTNLANELGHHLVVIIAEVPTIPGLVDTEGVRDHVTKARRLDLPHVNFFDAAFEKALRWTPWWMARLRK